MTTWDLFAIFCVSNTIMCWVQEVPIDMAKLIAKYSEYCGEESLCSLTDWKRFPADTNTNHSKFCPKCSCLDDCEENSNCCPDKTHSVCVQTKLRPFISEEENDMIMVSYCPQTYKVSYESCLKPIFRIYSMDEFVPVYSLKSNRTYVNNFCSACHGENETVPWKYYMSCPSRDKNFDDYTDSVLILAFVLQRRCSLTFTPPPNSFQQRCNMDSLIGRCNLTGYWDEKDEELLNACMQFKRPFGLYKNIFCFLCNTGRIQRRVLLSRNAFSDELQPFESKDRSFTYNVTKTHNEKVLHYSDAVVTLSESYKSADDTYVANITFLSYGIDEDIRNILAEYDEIKNYTESGDNVNLTSLYEEYVKSGGYRNWCHENHQVSKIFPGFKARKECTCDDTCYRFSSCCPDAAYFQRKSCSSADFHMLEKPMKKTYYFFVNKCPRNYSNTAIKLKCENYNDAWFFNTPVLNVRTKEPYRNLYCFICNNQEDVENINISHVRIWNASLACQNGLLIPDLMSSVAAIFQNAEQKRCSFHFVSSYFLDKCEPKIEPTIDTCNATGNAKLVSKDARFLCEEIDRGVMAKSQNRRYKNQICDLCNSETFEDPLPDIIASGTLDSLELSYNQIFSPPFYQDLRYGIDENIETEVRGCRDTEFNDEYKVK